LGEVKIMFDRTTRCVAALIAVGAVALPAAAEAQVYGQAGVQVGGGIGAGVNVQAGYAQPQPVVVQQQYQQPQPVYVQQQPQPVYVQQQPQYVQQPMVVQRGGRFRYGADLGGGWMFTGGDGGGLSGASITGSLRLGWQLNDQLAIYYQGDLPIGFAAGSVGSYDYSGAAVVLGNGVMGEWTFGDILSLAAGPSLDYAAGAVCSSTLSTSCIGSAGAYFGFQARVSVSLVSQSMGENTRRRGLRFGLSSHTSVIEATAFQFFDLHLGYEWF
jgi:hypothetical protein